MLQYLYFAELIRHALRSSAQFFLGTPTYPLLISSQSKRRMSGAQVSLIVYTFNNETTTHPFHTRECIRSARSRHVGDVIFSPDTQKTKQIETHKSTNAAHSTIGIGACNQFMQYIYNNTKYIYTTQTKVHLARISISISQQLQARQRTL